MNHTFIRHILPCLILPTLGLVLGLMFVGHNTHRLCYMLPEDKPADKVASHLYTEPYLTPDVKKILEVVEESTTHDLDHLMARESPVLADDPDLVSIVRRMLYPPSEGMIKYSQSLRSTPQSEAVVKILSSKRKGFFVECGALDGERSSNTIYLEQKLGWTGVLIEADPYFFSMALARNRRAYKLHACLSPKPHLTRITFKEDQGGQGKLGEEISNKTGANHCIPLYAILLALNQTKVDFFSLDVEGFEVPILETIPFDKVDIDTFAVEFAHGPNGRQPYKDLMFSKGYTLVDTIITSDPKISLYVNDYIFAKKLHASR